jgi:hypothetical protein
MIKSYKEFLNELYQNTMDNDDIHPEYYRDDYETESEPELEYRCEAYNENTQEAIVVQIDNESGEPYGEMYLVVTELTNPADIAQYVQNSDKSKFTPLTEDVIDEFLLKCTENSMYSPEFCKYLQELKASL